MISLDVIFFLDMPKLLVVDVLPAVDIGALLLLLLVLLTAYSLMLCF